jgi:hypothetical protein
MCSAGGAERLYPAEKKIKNYVLGPLYKPGMRRRSGSLAKPAA